MGLRAWAAWQNGQTALGPWSLLALEWQSALFYPVWARKPLCLSTVNLLPVHFVPRYMCQINCAWAVDIFFQCLWHISSCFLAPWHREVWSDSSCPIGDLLRAWGVYTHPQIQQYLLPNHKQLLEICYKMWFCPSIFHMPFNFQCLLIYNCRCLFNHHVEVCSMQIEWYTKCRDKIIGIIS